MTKLASDILDFMRKNKSADAHDILSAGLGSSESEVDFIIEQLIQFKHLER